MVNGDNTNYSTSFHFVKINIKYTIMLKMKPQKWFGMGKLGETVDKINCYFKEIDGTSMKHVERCR